MVGHISNFKFDTSVNLDDFDQVWLFAFESSNGISNSEINAIESYMNNGGGLFATGDHGALGKSMCGNIPRVKDMRYWDDTAAPNSTNEVSMRGKRRNDTNQPRPGNSTATSFDHQSDDIPQTIAVRTFGTGLPHPVLSIRTSLRPSGIIDVMPDHPHEGESKPETSFTVNGSTISSQIIATSFVVGGNTSGGKDATDPHCFPSICVWDGRKASVGRIVIDSTWHHFININLNGAGSIQNGLNNNDFEIVRQYYMNIARWMTRRKFIFCWRRRVIFDLLKDSQLIEASLNNPNEDMSKIDLADLNSIGALAEELLASKYNPALAREFIFDLIEGYNKDFANALNIWNPQNHEENTKGYHKNWINTDLVLHTAIGAGFIALRDDKFISSEDSDEKGIEKIYEIFKKGIDFGFQASIESLNVNIDNFRNELRYKGKE